MISPPTHQAVPLHQVPGPTRQTAIPERICPRRAVRIIASASGHHDPHRPHGEGIIEERHARAGESLEAERRASPVPPPVDVRRRWNAAAGPLAAWGRTSEDDLSRHQCQQQTADQRDGRRHRQAVRKPRRTIEHREGTVLQDPHDVTDGQALARLRSEGRQDLRSACCR